MRPNKIKQMWRDGRCVTLGWLSVSHGFSAEIMARQGFDALCVDLQHGTSEMKDVGPLLQAISQTDTVPVVRVAWNDPAAIMKALESMPTKLPGLLLASAPLMMVVSSLTSVCASGSTTALYIAGMNGPAPAAASIAVTP